jgi:alpha-glucosidase
VIEVDVGKQLSYAISYRGQRVVLASPITLDLAGGAPLGPGMRLDKQTSRSFDETWEDPHGKARRVRDHGREATLALVEAGGSKRRLDLTVRAYDDGVAFRYAIPEQPAFPNGFELAAERTELRFAGDHPAWAANFRTYQSSQEQEYRRRSIDQIAPEALIGLPALVRVPHGSSDTWVAFTESDLIDWAGAYLRGAKDGPAHTLVTSLSPRPDRPELAVVATAQRRSPWRVFLLGDRPGALVESNLVRTLATPSQIADASWVRPGRAAWDRWWSGDYLPGAKFKLGMNTATMKAFAALAGDMGWEHFIVDWTWYGPPFSKTATLDLTKVIPELDLPAVVAYARERKVGTWLWAKWDHVDRQMDAAFPVFAKWGIAGVKVDFMDRDDQVMVNFYSRLAKTAADHRLMVDLHGAFKPTGLERTWPNVLTREGVLGNEYNKWSNRVTPTHKTTLPFTRMLAGPMDFTPGGFRHAAPGSFKAKDSAPEVQGTRAAELALLVVYESALQVICDSPYEYERAKGAGAELLKQVPTVWDETRVLEGMPGEYVTIARRSGDKWYVGGITGDAERTARLPLAWLGKGDWSAHVWADAPDAHEHPERIVERDQVVGAADTLTVALAPAGGFAAVLTRR